MSPNLHSWPWKSMSNILSNDLYYLWLIKSYRIDFSIDFNIIEVEELKKSKINNVAMMADLENNINFEKISLTLKTKINHQSQVIDFGFSEILDFVYVRIDTKIESIACIHPEISKVIGKMCMTLSSKIKRSKYANYFNNFDIPGLENVRIDTKIMSVRYLQPEIRKVIHRYVWPSFPRLSIKVRWLILDFLRSPTL